jgi:hypothetical protein
MELKDKIDLIGKQIEIIKIKLFVFITVAGGSWVYVIKDDNSFLLNILLWFTFAICAFSLFLNMYRLGTYLKSLKEFENND